MNRQNFIKVLPPRALAEVETTHSLTQWKVNFRQYCKKDDHYKHFLASSVSWDASLTNYGFTAAINSREPELLAEDVQDFLLMLSSYLPHGYITDKILTRSKSFESAFAIIEEHYGLTPSQETLCDFSSLVRFAKSSRRNL